MNIFINPSDEFSFKKIFLSFQIIHFKFEDFIPEIVERNQFPQQFYIQKRRCNCKR